MGPMISDRASRLVEWNVEVLLRLLKQVVARRYYVQNEEPDRKPDADESSIARDTSKRVIDEVKEVVELPVVRYIDVDSDSIELDSCVVEQLYDYVFSIASIYRDTNPFHSKLLSI
jgi:hypothetical protein